MAKLTEKQLYGTCLDIKYVCALNEEYLDELKDQIKDLRK